VYQRICNGEPGVLLVGDAASFVEPLSSAGVRKAITSAWRAAVVVNTTLRDSAMSSIGREYFDQRERQVYSECLHRSNGFFSSAAAHYHTEFWQCRADSTVSGSPLNWRDGHDGSVEVTEIQAAFDQIRNASGATRFSAGHRLRFAHAPEVDGPILTMQEGILLPGASTPMLFAAGVRLAPLARIALGCQGIDAVFEQYDAHVGAVPPDELLSALALLVANGMLVPRSAVASTPRRQLIPEG
jgi:hypothetical protein